MISVAIVDDKLDSRVYLKRLIQNTDDFQCTGTYADVGSAVTGIQHQPPDVVLLDVDLPNEEGIACIKALRRAIPDLDILILTNQPDDQLLIEALRAGAHGFLDKRSFPSHLFNAIAEVHHGGVPMSRQIARRIVGFFSNSESVAVTLSDREQEVYELLCEGKNYREIAERLYVSRNTVRFHLKNIYRKLGVKSRFEAMRTRIDQKADLDS